MLYNTFFSASHLSFLITSNSSFCIVFDCFFSLFFILSFFLSWYQNYNYNSQMMSIKKICFFHLIILLRLLSFAQINQICSFFVFLLEKLILSILTFFLNIFSYYHNNWCGVFLPVCLTLREHMFQMLIVIEKNLCHIKASSRPDKIKWEKKMNETWGKHHKNSNCINNVLIYMSHKKTKKKKLFTYTVIKISIVLRACLLFLFHPRLNISTNTN